MAIAVKEEAPAKTAGIIWQPADQLVLRLAGNIQLDVTAAADRLLFESLAPGDDLELRVGAALTRAAIQWIHNRDGDLVGAMATKTVLIDSVWAGD